MTPTQVNPSKGYRQGSTAVIKMSPAREENVIDVVNGLLGYDVMQAQGAQRFALENFEIAEGHLEVGLETWPEYEE